MKKATGYIAVGAAVIAVGVYFYKRSKAKKEERVQEMVGMMKNAFQPTEEVKAEVAPIAKKILLKADKFFDVEVRNKMFHRFLVSLNETDRASFMHSYLYMKRELFKKYGPSFLNERKYIYMLECLLYTMDSKINKAHPNRNILKESVEAVRDEFLILMENPSAAYVAESNNFSDIFLKGEDLLKISDTARKQQLAH